MSWLFIDNSLYIYKNNINTNNTRYLLFDLDYTLIKPKGKNKFPKDKNDWKYIFNSNLKLKEEYNKGNTNIIIFTNQLDTKNNIEEIKLKIEDIIQDLNLPIEVYISIKDNKYRKPLWYMFDKMIELNNITNINKNISLYIGDAGGREKDFSSDDIKFAYNIGIPYKTPEEYFNNIIENYKISLINYNNYNNTNNFTKSNKQELILLVGYPGVGKSYFTNKYLSNYIHINQDTLKTLSKCLSETKKALKNNKSVVIDNTNPSKEIRLKYISLCNDFNISYRCIYFDISYEIAQHLNIYRELKGEKQRIPKIAYNVYKSKFIKPTLDEGYEEIIIWKLNLEFENDKNKEIYLKYY